MKVHITSQLGVVVWCLRLHCVGVLTTLHRLQISMGPPLVQFSTRANVKLPLVSPNGTTSAATFMLTFCDIFKPFLVFITASAIIGAPWNSGLPLHVSAAVVTVLYTLYSVICVQWKTFTVASFVICGML